jgi:hypothetical protein
MSIGTTATAGTFRSNFEDLVSFLNADLKMVQDGIKLKSGLMEKSKQLF